MKSVLHSTLLGIILLSVPVRAEITRIRVMPDRPGKNCVSPAMEEKLREILEAGSMDPRLQDISQPVLFSDPISGGMNSPGRTVVRYVDVNPNGSAFLDYTCRKVTYDGHRGEDILILNFVQMDEGVPVLAAADGVVSFRLDGKFDRYLEWQDATIGNSLIISHSETLASCYWHLKAWSIQVGPNQAVARGDTIAMVGSSGQSDHPHLHFQIGTDITPAREPYSGACNPIESWWEIQGEHVHDLPFQLQDHGLMTLPTTRSNLVERVPDKTHVTSGSVVSSWAMLRSVQSGSVITFEYKFNDAVQVQQSETVAVTTALDWWISSVTLSTDPSFFGTWTIDILHNDSLVAQQTFVHDDVPNQAPTLDPAFYISLPDSSVVGELVGHDPDGEIYRYFLDDGPFFGTFEQFGGRARKFRYTPRGGFQGPDSVLVFARDDELVDSPRVWIRFRTTSNPTPVAPVSSLQAVNTALGIEISWWGYPSGQTSVRLLERRAGQGPFLEIARGPLKEGRNVLQDLDVDSGVRYDYRVVVLTRTGEHLVFGPVSVTAGTTPEILVLSPGHPNPFTASTNLQLTLPEPAAVVLEVFDARGRRVRTLDLGRQAAGAHSVSWDGLDDRGVRAAPGVFFLRVTAGEVLRTRKVILIAG